MSILSGNKCCESNNALLLSLNATFEEYSDFTQPEDEMIKFVQSITELLSKTPIAIYGAGMAGEHFFEVLGDLGISPICYFDKKADDLKELKGIPVYNPNEIRSIAGDNV